MCLTQLSSYCNQYPRLNEKLDDNAKPPARMGRKAYGSQEDSRVAEFTHFAPGFFCAQSFL
jgi:hypothetical protein